MATTFSTEVRWIPEYSIVRLPDGRVGYLEKNTGGKPQVRVELDLAVEVEPCAILELLSYPAELARERLEQHSIAIACPHCGDPAVRIPVDELDGLHTGVTIECPECGGDIVFEITTPDARANAVEFLKERAACGGWPIPYTPEEITAWALDEMTVQIELAQEYPDEATDRVASAARFAGLAAEYLQNGAVPATLPWEGSLRDLVLELEAKEKLYGYCRVCQVAIPTHPGGMCAGCLDATSSRSRERHSGFTTTSR